MRWMALVLLVITLTACGNPGNGEDAVLPTLASFDGDATAADTPADTAPTAEPTVAPAVPVATVVPGFDSNNFSPVRRGDSAQYAVVARTNPDEGRVVNGEIYVLDASGGRLQRVTYDPGLDASPAWLPDGNRMLFVSNREGRERVFIVDVTSVRGEATRLTNLPEADERDPDFAPHAELALFSARVLPDEDFEIYRFDTIRREATQLTDNDTDDTDPVWSPDGSRLAFVSQRDGNPELYIMDADGANTLRLTDHPGIDIDPSFSPRGDRLLFVSDRDGIPNIYELTLPGARLAYLEIPLPEPGELPPRIQVRRSQPTEIFRLTTDSEIKSEPAYAPSQETFYYVSFIDGLGLALNIASANGRLLETINPPGVFFVSPELRP